MIFRRGAHTFLTEISLLSSAPSSFKSVLRQTAQSALKQIPQNTLRRKLKPNLTYRLSIAVISSGKMKRLNSLYRRKNKVTDVLSFSRLEGKRTPVPELGDIVLCWSVAKRQAVENNISVREELQRLSVHGLLHLFGYDHEKSKKEEKRMFRLQNQIIRHLK